MRLSYLLILSISITALLFVGCKDDSLDPTGITTKEPEPDTTDTDYTAPTYADDYSSIASWSDHSQWNLANVHDPSVVFDGSYYYMYSTDASYGSTHVGQGHFLARRSKDLVNWEFIGMAMSTEPAWVKDSLNNMRARVGLSAIDSPRYGFWAPIIRKVGNKYRMYYSVVVDNFIGNGLANTADNFDNTWTERAFIGMMETSDLSSNQWTDHGMVICSVSDKGDDWSRSSYTSDWNAYFKYNAIDPSMIVTQEGENWLVYGSWHSGIVALQLNPDTGLPLNKFDINDESTWGTRIYTRANGSRWQASEGPEIIYNAETGYYYLFLAYDELSVAYNTRVCRATSITGPYYSYNESSASGGDCFPIITHPYKFNNHSGWVGFSHCCVFYDETNKQWYYCSQARLPENTNGNTYSNAIMMGHVRKIEWTENGWPVVLPERYAAVPQDAITESDLVGDWEVITLNYQFKVQQTSSTMTLSSGNAATGAVTGTWLYNSATGILTIGSLKLNVVRELNWEASPRVPTIVFTGLNGSGRSVWGKKS